MPNQWTGPSDLRARFWAKVDKGGLHGCWDWTACTMNNGYGIFGLRKGKMTLVHRFAYEILVGPIPKGMVIDHLCRNRRCVNPAHMEAVTQLENVRRGRAGANHGTKTHCPQGHAYDEANTYTPPGRGGRLCRQCRRERNRRYGKRKWRAGLSRCEDPPVG